MISLEEAIKLAEARFHEMHKNRKVKFSHIFEDDNYYALGNDEKYRVIGDRAFLVDKTTGEVITFNPNPHHGYGKLIPKMRKIR